MSCAILRYNMAMLTVLFASLFVDVRVGLRRWVGGKKWDGMGWDRIKESFDGLMVGWLLLSLWEGLLSLVFTFKSSGLQVILFPSGRQFRSAIFYKKFDLQWMKQISICTLTPRYSAKVNIPFPKYSSIFILWVDEKKVEYINLEWYGDINFSYFCNVLRNCELVNYNKERRDDLGKFLMFLSCLVGKGL